MRRESAINALALCTAAGLSTGASAIDWAAVADGNWNTPANWVGADVPDMITDDAVLGLSGMYTVSITNNFTHGSLSITNPDAVLTLGSIFHTLNGDLSNNGTIVINTTASIFNSHIGFNTDAMISGSGEIVLNGSTADDAQIIATAPFVVSHAAGHTIRGVGRLSGSMTNEGLIIADSMVGDLQLAGTLQQIADGSAEADGGVLVLNSGSITTGGSLDTSNGGTVVVGSGTATVGDIANLGDLHIPGQARFLSLTDSIANTGTITVNSDESIFNAHISFDATTSIGGSGDVLMISTGDLGDAQILTSGMFVGTIGALQTVHGSGLISGVNGGTIRNTGTINGNDPDHGLGLTGTHNGTGGVYRSDNGTLLLRNGLVLTAGTFESSGTGSVTKDSNGFGALAGVTNNGDLNILGDGASIDINGTLFNNGTLTINSNVNIFNAHLRSAVDATIGGTGTVDMLIAGNLDDAQILTDDAIFFAVGEDQTVQGAGRINGTNGGTINNFGVINGNTAAFDKAPAQELRLMGNHNGSGGGVYRSDDGILGLSNGLMLTGGTFDSSGVGIVNMTTNGVATLSDVTNIGQMGIRGDGGTIALVGPMVNDGDLLVNSNTNIFNAHLRFDASTSITGSGTVTMVTAGNLNDAQFYTNDVFDATIGAGQTVQGAGLVDGRHGGTIVNNGTINGNDPAVELRLQGNHDGSGGGVYRSDNGVLGLSNGLVMNGGTFDSLGTGSVTMTTNGSATLSSITNIGTMGILGSGGIVELVGPLTNDGIININSDVNIFNAHIRFLNDTVIDGDGVINMVTAGNFGDAQIIADTDITGTIGAGQTVAGEGLLVGTMNIDGTLDPGAGFRELRIDQVTMSSSSGMIADLGGINPGEFDRLTLNNDDTIELGGTLTVNIDPGYFPNFGDLWEIIDGGTVMGEFDSVVLPDAQIGQEYRVIYNMSRVYVIVTCDADLNGDSTIDFLDISLFINYFTNNDVRGDFNGDNQFDFLDISIFISLLTGDCVE